MTTDPDFLICVLYEKGARTIVGSRLALCVECRRPVMISPSSGRTILGRDGEPLIICMGCFLGAFEGGDEINIEPFNDAQREELKSEGLL